MRKPEVTVLGAGSYFFGMPFIYKAATSPVLDGGTLALVDTDPKAMDKMLPLAKRIFKNSKFSSGRRTPCRITGMNNLPACLPAFFLFLRD